MGRYGNLVSIMKVDCDEAKSSAGKSTWYRLRQAQGSEAWVGMAHFTPGVSQNAHAVEVDSKSGA